MLKKTFEYRKTTDGLQTTDRQVAPLLFVYLCLLSHSLFYSLIICKNDVISFFQSNYFELNYSPQTNSIVVNTAASLSGKILNLLLFFIKAHRSSVCCPNWLNPSPINLNFLPLFHSYFPESIYQNWLVQFRQYNDDIMYVFV